MAETSVSGTTAVPTSNSMSREIREEHKIWKYNTMVLYDMVMTHLLEWPSLTVEWMHGLAPCSGTSSEVVQRLIVGTHTSNPEVQNFLLVFEVNLPIGRAGESICYEERIDYSGFKFGSAENRKFNIVKCIPHDGEINRATHMTQRPNWIATRTVGGDVCLFDTNNYAADVPKEKVEMTPDLVLKGHQLEGWGINWNQHREGFLASVADDGRLCIWDINARTNGTKKLEALHVLTAHTKPAQDVCWQSNNDHVLMTVGDDGKLMIWDIREDCSSQPVAQVQVCNLEVNSVTSNAFTTDVMATGGADQDVNLWHLRKLQKPVHRMSSHKAAIVRLQFTSYCEKLLASASSDRFINIWDVDRIGMEQTPEDVEDGPPELVFSHGGHTAPVSDISWNPEEPYRWMMASVAEDNVLQIWQPSKATFDEDEDEEAEEEEDDFAVE